MKHSIFALSLVLAPLFCQAQDFRRHQISAYVNLGNANTHDFEIEKDDFFQIDPDDPEGYYDCGLPIQHAGYGISYSYSVNENLKLGVCGGLSFANDSELYTYENAAIDHHWNKSYIIESKLWYVMPTAEYVWFNKRIVRMYSSASLGIAHINNEKTLNRTFYKDNIEKQGEYWLYNGSTKESTYSEDYSTSGTKFAYQVVPFGIEVGSRRCCFFQEWGYGYKGVFMAGIRFSF